MVLVHFLLVCGGGVVKFHHSIVPRGLKVVQVGTFWYEDLGKLRVLTFGCHLLAL